MKSLVILAVTINDGFYFIKKQETRFERKLYKKK